MRSKHTVLVVDDHAAVLEGIVDFLESFGYRVLSTLRGQDAIRLALEENPDAIVCDYILPDLDGLSVLRLLRRCEETAGLPYILLSSRADAEALRELQRYPLTAFLDKCSGIGNLLDTLDRFLPGETPENPRIPA